MINEYVTKSSTVKNEKRREFITAQTIQKRRAHSKINTIYGKSQFDKIKAKPNNNHKIYLNIQSETLPNVDELIKQKQNLIITLQKEIEELEQSKQKMRSPKLKFSIANEVFTPHMSSKFSSFSGEAQLSSRTQFPSSTKNKKTIKIKFYNPNKTSTANISNFLLSDNDTEKRFDTVQTIDYASIAVDDLNNEFTFLKSRTKNILDRYNKQLLQFMSK